MKSKIYTFVALLATTLAVNLTAQGQQPGMAYDTIYMGATYKNEIYYSMSAGEQGKADRGLWDIAFRTNRMSASIITNDGSYPNGVELYTYPNADTSGWAFVNTTGIANWKKMVNSTTDWETGAFNQNQSKHPDYGWCIYNSLHNLVGDSLFVIKLRDGSFRKLWIKEKNASDNIIQFRFANIDGSGDNTVTLDCISYTPKNFVGYSLATNQVVDFEPVASNKWDILFTKYVYTYPVGSPNYGSIYTVTGVLSNYKVKVKKMEHVPKDTIISVPQVMDPSRSAIGHEWKKPNANYGLDIVDSLVYFVQDFGGQIHKLVFKEFVGSSTGRIVLEKGQITLTGIGENPKSGFNAAIYPNPVNDVMNLVINPGKSKLAVVSILDMSGRMVLNKKYEIQAEDLSTLQIPVSDLPSGMYMVKIQAGGKVISRKVIVNN
jgi:hypothetical protein